MDTAWLITDKGDPLARALVDGEVTNEKPHYSRQTPGARQFTRNGQNLVFISKDLKAVWVTFRPTPGKAVRPDKLQCWECALFCSRGSQYLSSYLIEEAVELSCALWGRPPVDGIITFIKPSAIQSANPGYCYKKAGWVVTGRAKDGKPRLTAPLPFAVRPFASWSFHANRGGKLRRELEVKHVPCPVPFA